MKKILYLILPVLVAGCVIQRPAKNYKTISDSGQTVDFTYMDTNTDPQVDFFQYANGAWIKNNPVPASETKWGSFNQLQENNYQKLKAIVEEVSKQKHEPGEPEQLIGDFYFTYMDKPGRQKYGISPIAEYLRIINEMSAIDDLPSVLAELHSNGFPGFFEISVEQDLKNNDRHALYISQGGLSLPSKSYYFKTQQESEQLREDFNNYVAEMLETLEMDVSNHKKILDIETQLAEVSMSRVELRNYFAQYNPTALRDLRAMSGGFDWNTYLEAVKIKDIDTVIVTQPKFIGFMSEVMAIPLDDIKFYLQWHVINSMAKYLHEEVTNRHFDFYGTRINGQQERKEDWKEAIDMISSMKISEALGRLFVEEHFNEDAKEKVNTMVDDLMAVYKERLQNLEWMSSSTKEAALHKLSTFTRKLGYPDNWQDYESLHIQRKSFADNVLSIKKFAFKKSVDKLDEDIDKEKWEMAPHIVNAYYNPLQNEIVFPAGIMQPPFFDPQKEDAVNYARMGMVIGHELTHGFDDQGAQFTAEGEFKNWWSEKDKLQFSARTEKLSNQFNSYEALPGLKINGQLTLGENIADLGGLTIAYHAYQKSLEDDERNRINGFTNEQRFFLAFAQLWKINYTDDAMKLQVNTNPHAPGKWRVIGPLSNMPEFYEAFDVKPGDPMRQPEDKTAKIW